MTNVLGSTLLTLAFASSSWAATLNGGIQSDVKQQRYVQIAQVDRPAKPILGTVQSKKKISRENAARKGVAVPSPKKGGDTDPSIPRPPGEQGRPPPKSMSPASR